MGINIDENPILKHSFNFSILILEYCDLLLEKNRFVLANQLTKSGTSIGANAMEAQDAESKSDFIHKMKIASKEAGETFYWLSLCARAKNYPDCSDLLKRLGEIRRILNTIIGTSKRRYQKARTSKGEED